MEHGAEMNEQAIVFGSKSPLVGIYSPGVAPTGRIGVVLANSGVVHRIGANRTSVTLARRLAHAGIGSLRFDMSGLGDSLGDTADAEGWEKSAPREISEAVTQLLLLENVDHVVLYGNCGGAAKCFWAAGMDRRVSAMALTNPPPHPAESEGADTQASTAAAREVATQLDRLFTRGLRALFVFGEGDPGQFYFERRLATALQAALRSDRLQLAHVPGSNHTFALVPAQERMISIVVEWVKGLAKEGN